MAKSMDGGTRIFVFGDQTDDIADGLRDLLSPNENAGYFLQPFFTKAYLEIRAELGRIAQGEDFQRFSSIQDLAALHRRGQLHPSLHPALACVFQLGYFIRQYGRNGGLYDKPSDSYVLGIGTGALAAVAISSCISLSELLPLAVKTVGIAFRLGLYTVQVGESITKHASSDPLAWSMTISDLAAADANQALCTFLEENLLPPASRPCILEVADGNITFGGSPAVLQALKHSQFSTFTTIDTPRYAPFHNPRLFGNGDIKNLLGTDTLEPWSEFPARIPMLSSSNGKFMKAENYGLLLETALRDILLRPILWEEVVHGISYAAGFARDMDIILHGSSIHAQDTLCAGLKTRGYKVAISINPKPEPSSQQSGQARPKIAIVGMSGRFPEAENPAAFWDLLCQGLDVHRVVPETRWDVKTHVDITGKRKNTSGTPFGCWLNNPGHFDARFFNMSPREAPEVDPAQRIALMTAYEAMETAGMVPGATPSTRKDRVGVFYGVTSNDWMEVNSAQNIDTYFIPGGCRAFIPGRINYFFKFSGPSYSIDTACSSSLAAIHTACNLLWQRDIDTAIAGGTNVLTNPDYTAGLDRGHFLSRTGNCKSFDDEADGYCRGEGVVTVILKRLEDAIADNDPIQAVIAGAYTNHSSEAGSITRPHQGAQEAVFTKILNDANVDAHDVSYVEMHGTGTQAGDPTEMGSVLETFAPLRNPRRSDQKVYVGSAKANIGHGEAAAGVTSLAKVLLMMKANIIPPHCGIKTKINRSFPTDLLQRNVFVASTPMPWLKPVDGLRRAFINNFSAAGGNTALLIEDSPSGSHQQGKELRTSLPVTVSAKSPTSLRSNVESLAHFLALNPQTSLPELSYTTTARRVHYLHRVVVSGSSIAQIQTGLRQALDRGDGTMRPKSAPKITFAFAGNGSQYPGMGKELFENVPSFRAEVSRLDQLVQNQGFPSILPIFSALGGDIEDYSPVVVQLATVCLEMALARLWISWGAIPSSVVGHSLGEYAALNIGGVLSDSDTIYLVGRRAQLLQEKCTHGTHAMLAVKASQSIISQHLRDLEYEIACINSPECIVIGGMREVINEIRDILTRSKLSSILLPVPYAYHSTQVDPALQDFELVAQTVTFRKPDIPILSPLLSALVDDVGTFGPSYLSAHCRRPVNMVGALQNARNSGLLTNQSVVLDIGPHPTFRGMVEPTLGAQVAVLSTLNRGLDLWSMIATSISSLYAAGTDINWREYHRGFKSCHKVLQLPTYNWDLKDYWIQYVNDWSLRKGDPLPALQFPPLENVSATTTFVPQPESSTIHGLLEDTLVDGKISIISETNLSHPDLIGLAQGHKVNRIPLCTPSVYADIALTLISYIVDRYQPHRKGCLTEIAEMTIEHALVAHGKSEPQLLRTHLTLDLNKDSAACKFSNDKSGKELVNYSHCVVRFKNKSETLRTLQARISPTKTRISELESSVKAGNTYRFSSSMIYRMVATLAQFDPEYQALDEIILDSHAMEASSIASFAKVKKGGRFHTHPAFIDALSQPAGFVMNANEKSNLEKEVFVNHGWRNFQLFERISDNKAYQMLVKMSELPGNAWAGDLLVLDGEVIVANFEGIVLQGVPRRVLHYILSKEQENISPSQATKAAIHKPALLKPPSGPTHMPKETVQLMATRGLGISTNNRSKPEVTVVSQGTAKVRASLDSEIVVAALQIISEESGISISELTDASVFADMGIDSLLILQISSRFKDDLNLDVEASTFNGLSTIQDLKEHLEPRGIENSVIQHTNAIAHAEALPIMRVRESLQIKTPFTILPRSEAKHVTYLRPEELFSVDSGITRGLQIIAEESGVAVAELTDDVVFADIGIDSLLSLMILARYRDELSLQSNNISDLFVEYPTVKELKQLLSGTGTVAEKKIPFPINVITANISLSNSPDSPTSSPTWDTSQQMSRARDTPGPSPTMSEITRYGTPPPKSALSSIRQASSVILQGRPRSAAKILILFPDGSGSATSYVNTAPVRKDLCIICLNCPYLRTPEEMLESSLDALIESYITEIRRRQPFGPYNLGGWSCGGILAYKATQRLIQEGEEVESLVLIDAPVPKGLDALPKRWYDHCVSNGIFKELMPRAKSSASGISQVPEWLVPHFQANVEVLRNYFAEPLPAGFTPKTSIVWASECVTDGVKFPAFRTDKNDPQGIKFLTEKRTDFTAGEWAELFPGDVIEVEVMQGANHFSLMGPDYSTRLAAFLDSATK